MYKSMDYKAKVKEVNTHEKRGRLLSLETLLHKKNTRNSSHSDLSMRILFGNIMHIKHIYEIYMNHLLFDFYY